MARRNQVVEMNTFVSGLVTEASPLTFPDNASIDENNFELLKNGSRRRRLGMDLENDYQEISTSVTTPTSNELGFSSFKWPNAGGIAGFDILTIQVGNELKFFEFGPSVISSTLLYTYTYDESIKFTKFSYAMVDGLLVVASGLKDVVVFDYNETDGISNTTSILYIRDLFGLEDIDPKTNRDLSIGSNITTRPESITHPHLYNLRNQGWGQARRVSTSEDIRDPIYEFHRVASSSSNLYHAVLIRYSNDESPEVYTIYNKNASSRKRYTTFSANSHPDGVTIVRVDENSLGTLDYDNDGVGETLTVGNFLVWDQEIQSWYQTSISPLEDDGTFPSNSDTVISEFYPDANDSDNRTADRFHAQNLVSNPVGSTPAPKGFFIIDALERGTSRLSEYTNLLTNDVRLIYPITDIPLDKTPGGPSCVAAYAGRVFYAGFSGEVYGGDSKSPRMTSYVLFSKVISNKSDINLCYQEGDPTSVDEPDLLDTDGGFIRIDGAYNIVSMINVGTSLAVIAANGVWMIRGGSDYGFTANNYSVDKITEHGCNNPSSVVLVDGNIMYWSDDGIYVIAKDDFGDFKSTSLTAKTIQTLYGSIDPKSKLHCQGNYDSYDGKVRWVYNNYTTATGDVKELVLDVNLGAFYKSTIGSMEGGYPKVILPVEVPPFTLNEFVEDVVNNGELITYNGEQVVNTRLVKVSGTREIAYLCLTEDSPTISFSFSKYYDPTFYDWVSVDGTGVDAAAHLVTGYSSGGDFQLDKQVPYITFHFERTENGFYTDINGNLWPLNESSCKVQAQWNWANSANSGKWGSIFEAYRYGRHYLSSGVSDEYDYGFSVLSTKNKLRGKGKVLSLYITTSPGKDCRLLGWSLLFSVDSNV